MIMEIENLKITDVYLTTCGCEGFVVCWSANIGFGEVTFYKEKNKWYADTECMGKDFCKLLLDKFLEMIEVEE